MALKHVSAYKTGHAEHSASDIDDDDEGPYKELADRWYQLFVGIYGMDTMIRKYPNEPALKLGRRAAIRALIEKTPQQLSHGERLLEKDPPSWPPTPGEFAKLCVTVPEHQPFPCKQLEHKADKETARAWLQRIRGNLGCQSK